MIDNHAYNVLRTEPTYMLQYDPKSVIKTRSPIWGQLSILNEMFEIPNYYIP